MANAASVALLNDSLSDLSRTLLQSRALRQQQEEATARNELGQRMAGLHEREATSREADYGDQRANRAKVLENQAAANTDLAAYHKAMLAAKTDEEKMAIWEKVLKSGAMTTQGLDAMAKAMTDKLGVQVTLKMPEPMVPKPYYGDPSEGNTKPVGDYMGNIYSARHSTTPAVPTETVKTDAQGNETERTTHRPLPTPTEQATMAAAYLKQLQAERANAEGMRDFGASGQPALVAPPAAAAAPVQPLPAAGLPPAPAATGIPATSQPPKPADKSDAQLLREAADAIEKNPDNGLRVLARLKAWGFPVIVPPAK